jgi:phage replication-related protein YjqB (UPF0714/DUF867 family)
VNPLFFNDFVIDFANFYSGEDPIVYVGGKDKKLAKSITKSLKNKGFTVQKKQ